MSEIHKGNWAELKERQKWFKVPVIVLSGINSVLAAGVLSMDADVVSTVSCILALTVGVIGSVELYLGISEHMNTEYVSGRDFTIMHFDITKTLALRPEERGVGGQVYLEHMSNDYRSYVKNSEPVVGAEIQAIQKQLDKMERDRSSKQKRAKGADEASVSSTESGGRNSRAGTLGIAPFLPNTTRFPAHAHSLQPQELQMAVIHREERPLEGARRPLHATSGEGWVEWQEPSTTSTVHTTIPDRHARMFM